MDNELSERLGDISEKLGKLQGSQEGMALQMQLTREDMNRRINKVETDKRRDDWISSGITFVASVLASWFGMGVRHG